MQTANTNRGQRSKDLTWYLVGEFPLCSFISDATIDDKIKAAMCSQMGGNIENQKESIERVSIKLSALAKEVVENFTPGRAEAAGRMRIYCQMKMIEESVNGGWGYFVIERSSEAVTCAGREPDHAVDVYFYKEGV